MFLFDINLFLINITCWQESGQDCSPQVWHCTPPRLCRRIQTQSWSSHVPQGQMILALSRQMGRNHFWTSWGITNIKCKIRNLAWKLFILYFYTNFPWAPEGLRTFCKVLLSARHGIMAPWKKTNSIVALKIVSDPLHLMVLFQYQTFS